MSLDLSRIIGVQLKSEVQGNMNEKYSHLEKCKQTNFRCET